MTANEIASPQALLQSGVRTTFNSTRWESVTDEMAEILRQKTGGERLAIADGMWRSIWKMLYWSFQQQHPEWSVEQCTRETARSMSHGAV